MLGIKTFAAFCLGAVLLSGCSEYEVDWNDAASIAYRDIYRGRSFVMDRDFVDTIYYHGRYYVVQDFEFAHRRGWPHEARYVLIDHRRIPCGGDCRAALIRGLADSDLGENNV